MLIRKKLLAILTSTLLLSIGIPINSWAAVPQVKLQISNVKTGQMCDKDGDAILIDWVKHYGKTICQLFTSVNSNVKGKLFLQIDESGTWVRNYESNLISKASISNQYRTGIKINGLGDKYNKVNKTWCNSDSCGDIGLQIPRLTNECNPDAAPYCFGEGEICESPSEGPISVRIELVTSTKTYFSNVIKIRYINGNRFAVSGSYCKLQSTPVEINSQSLNVPPPPVGNVKTKIECLKQACFYNGEVPEGSIIVVNIPKNDWNQYASVNSITAFQYKYVSPKGRVTLGQKILFPLALDSVSLETDIVGVWKIQVRAYNNNKFTDWSNAVDVNVKVLSQKYNGLKKCSSELEAALQRGANSASNLMRDIEYGWSKYFEMKANYQKAQIFDRAHMMDWYKLMMDWRSYLQTRYISANGLYSAYNDAIKTCNSSVVFPTYIEPKE